MTTLPSPGDRIRMTGLMPDDPCPIPVGTEGTVREVNPYFFEGRQQIYVDWDDNRSLILLSTDPYEVIASAGDPH